MKTAQLPGLRVRPAWRAARILAGSVGAMAAGTIGPVAMGGFWLSFRRAVVGDILSRLVLSAEEACVTAPDTQEE